jgi:hypothetical protein
VSSRRPPPEQTPPVLFDTTDELVVQSPHPGSATGQPFAVQGLRDCTLDAELGLLAGADEDRYGLFFRQAGPERYVACTISAAGHLSVGLVDGGPPLLIAEGLVLDPRYVAGGTGALLIHTSPGADARLVVRWAQARAILPDQPATAAG